MSTQFEEKEYHKRLDFGLWKKLAYFLKPYTKEILGLGLVMLVVAGIDAFIPIMTRDAIDNYVVPGNLEGLRLFGLGYLVLIIVQAFNVWLLICLAGRIEVGLCYDIRQAGFKKLQELSFSYYDKTPVGWIMARMTSDSMKLGETISWGFVDGVWGLAMMIAVACFMLVMHWKLALVTLAVLPVLAVISVIFQQKILAGHRKVRKTNSKISGAYNEGLSGAKTSKTLVREAANLVEFQHLSGGMRYHSIKTAIFSSLFLPVVLVLSSIGTAVALWYGGSIVITQVITYGTLVAFLSYTVQFFEPVRELARVLTELQSAQASAERIVTMLETEPDIRDPQQPSSESTGTNSRKNSANTDKIISTDNTAGNKSSKKEAVKHPLVMKFPFKAFFSKGIAHKLCSTDCRGVNPSPPSKHITKIKGKVDFERVGFHYQDGEAVLQNFSLSVAPGETVALVGESGSGKSTIVNLACRFYEPNTGVIKIDGIDYRERPQLWLHSNLGYVLQTPHLFSGTIRENIRYGRLEASDEEVEAAARLVNAHVFIDSLSQGYENQVGEGGAMLSLGQKQLICFARALLADPAIFVLDEATSSIDTETEQLINHAIELVLKNRTSFIIAHRLSTVKNAHRILVLKKGRIIEEGNHEKLIQKKGYYYRLYTNQFINKTQEELLRGQCITRPGKTGAEKHNTNI